MPATSESIKRDIEKLTDMQLQKVAEFIAFLRFQKKQSRTKLDPTLLAPLATEFAEEDIALAESGMDDYKAMLVQEDQL